MPQLLLVRNVKTDAPMGACHKKKCWPKLREKKGWEEAFLSADHIEGHCAECGLSGFKGASFRVEETH